MTDLLNHLPVPLLGLAFIVSTGIITVIGTRLVSVADRLADETGIGEAITGGLILGAATSLPGLIASVTAAFNGYAEMAISNSIGGIAAQSAFLGIADICYRKANLEHAAASVANLMQGGLLIVLLSVPLVAATLPDVQWFLPVHPASFLMIAAYIYGMRLVSRSQEVPMWRPRRTDATQQDELDSHPQSGTSQLPLWTRFVALGVVIALAGWTVAQLGIAIMNKTEISESLVGGLFTAVSSSLPELVTSIAAVKRGAYTLCVGGIIGGNAFDTLFMAVADMAYRPGSIFHTISGDQVFLISISILMTAILIMGLLSREKRGIANIGFESFAILVLYGIVVLKLVFY